MEELASGEELGAAWILVTKRSGIRTEALFRERKPCFSFDLLPTFIRITRADNRHPTDPSNASVSLTARRVAEAGPGAKTLPSQILEIIVPSVHAFLEQWGLINYQPENDPKPTFIGPDFRKNFRITTLPVKSTIAHGPLSREFQHQQSEAIAAESAPKTPVPSSAKQPALETSSANKIIPRKRGVEEIDDPTVPDRKVAALTDADHSVATGETESEHDSGVLTVASKVEVPRRSRRSCAICFSDCSGFYYHSIKVTGFNLCAGCYSDGRFPATMISSDFVKIDFHTGVDRAVATSDLVRDESIPWNESELFLLLEGVELFDDDWAKVADHVGTRSKSQCIACFLQLPMEDRHVPGGSDGTVGDLVTLLAEADAGFGRVLKQRPLSGALSRIPLSIDANPCLGIAALLVGVVRPEVANIATKAAIRAVEEVKKKRLMDRLRKEAAEIKEHEAARQSFIATKQRVSSGSPLKGQPVQPLPNGSATLSPSKANTPAALHPSPSRTVPDPTAVNSKSTHSDSDDLDDLWLPENLGIEASKEARRLRLRHHHLESQLYAERLKNLLEVDAALEAERSDLEAERKLLMHDRVVLGRDRVLASMLAQVAREQQQQQQQQTQSRQAPPEALPPKEKLQFPQTFPPLPHHLPPQPYRLPHAHMGGDGVQPSQMPGGASSAAGFHVQSHPANPYHPAGTPASAGMPWLGTTPSGMGMPGTPLHPNARPPMTPGFVGSGHAGTPAGMGMMPVGMPGVGRPGGMGKGAYGAPAPTTG
ncbi:hypothetical protein HDU96_000024 [Phlyctochytrium bullatum]|nr:hypothetical protein HDU96_000024 [Phlyctochytrium bullatum]